MGEGKVCKVKGFEVEQFRGLNVGSIECRSAVVSREITTELSADTLTDSLLKYPCEPRTLLEYFVSAAS